MNSYVFLPWNPQQEGGKQTRKHLYFSSEQEPNLFSMNCLHGIKKPFFSMPTPRGTVELFMDALQNNEEEAKGYLCKSLLQFVDIEEIRRMFEGEKPYQYFLSNQRSKLGRVSIATKSKTGKKQIIEVEMIAEPDVFGKWKICHIEKS